MENLENQEEISKVSSVLEKYEMSERTASNRTASVMNKAKSVSFSFFGDNNLRLSHDTEESVNKTVTTDENFPKKIYTNVSSSSNETKRANQSNLSLNFLQPNPETSSGLTDNDNSIKQHEETTYFGWDGYQERFNDTDSTESIPHCIPPWAKTMQKKYGVSLSSYSQENESKDDTNVKEKIRQLMNKYNDLMLVKRVESKKQVIVEQAKNHDGIDTVKSRAIHTRYYVAPLSKGDIKTKEESDNDKNPSSIENNSFYSDNISLTKKTSKTQAKRKVQGIIHPVIKTTTENKNGTIGTKDQRKCQKLTLSNIRDYVNAQSMTPDQRKLHEIIKVETVPSINGEMREKAPSKYIINVPQNKATDGATINVIKIKEKRKLRVQSIEDVREKTTELHYSKGTPQVKEAKLNILPQNEKSERTIVSKTVKSPTETKTLQVTSKTTPHIIPFIESENNTDKVLLIQYDKKSAKDKSKDAKHSKYTTKLFGARRPGLDENGDMYLYESETCGEQQKEYTAKVEGVHPTLKEKLDSIFDELRDLVPKKEILPGTICSDVQVKPQQSDHGSQGPLQPIGTDVVSVQVMPDVKSVQIQVRESQILSPGFIAPHPSPHSGYIPELMETDERLENTSKYLLTYAHPEFDDESNITENKSFAKKEDIAKQFSEDKQTLESEKEQISGIDEYEEIRKSEQSDKQNEDKGKYDKERYDDVSVGNDQEDRDIIQEKLLQIDGKSDDKLLPHDGTMDEAQDEEDKLDEQVDLAEVVDELGISKDPAAPSDLKTGDKSKDGESYIPKEQQAENDKVQARSVTSSEIHLTKNEKESEEEKVDEYRKERAQDTIRTVKESHRGSLGTERTIDTPAFKIDEDIRSYNLDSFRDTKLTFTSPSKFLHKKNSIRKRLNWSDDTLYLEKHLCPQLVRGLAETAIRRPADPVEFLARWIYKEHQNREQAEIEAVHREHLQLERTMCDVQRPVALVHRRFNLKKYPAQRLPTNAEHEISEKSVTESFKDGAIENVAQDA